MRSRASPGVAMPAVPLGSRASRKPRSHVQLHLYTQCFTLSNRRWCPPSGLTCAAPLWAYATCTAGRASTPVARLAQASAPV